MAHVDMLLASQDVERLDEAVARCAAVADSLDDDDPLLAQFVARRGLAAAALAWRREIDPVDAIELLSAAFDMLDDTTELSGMVFLQLGVTHAQRFLRHSGEQENADSAVEILTAIVDTEGIDADIAGQCHAVLAQLEIGRLLPAELRRGEFADMGEFDLARLGPAVAVHANNAMRHLNAVPTPMAPDAAATLALTRSLAAAADGEVDMATVDEVLALLDQTAGLVPDGGGGELAALRAGLEAFRSDRYGSPEQADAAFDGLTEAVARLPEGHPTRSLLLNLIGHTARMPQTPRSAEEHDVTVRRLERALAQMPADHPERVRTLVRLALALVEGMWIDRSGTSLDPVLQLLTDAIARPATDPVNDAVNRLLFGIVVGVRGVMSHDIALVADGMRSVSDALAAAPAGHEVYAAGRAALSGLLFARYTLGADLEDLDVVRFLGEHDDETADGTTLALSRFMRAVARIAREQHRFTAAALDEVAADLTFAREHLPAGHPFAQQVDSVMGAVRMFRSSVGGGEFSYDTARANLPDFRDGVEAFAQTLPGTPETGVGYPGEAASIGMAYIGDAFVSRDARRFDRGLTLLRDASAAPGLRPHERASFLVSLGVGFRLRYEVVRRRRDLDNAIDRLAEGAQLLLDEVPDADAAAALHMLGDSYHTRADEALRDRRRAVAVGLDSLRERATQVRLQTGAARALAAASAAADDAVAVARWCLAARAPDSAVRALELGRAMVLQVSTSDASVPALLRERGAHDLADEWDAARSDGPAPWDLPADRGERLLAMMTVPQVPNGLRRRVLSVIGDDSTELPTVEDIVAVLADRGVTALVYLFPADEDGRGTAIVVGADGQVRAHTLSALRVGAEIEAYDRASAADLRRVLGDLCDWAWPAAMADVLAAVGPRPRLVLVPVGRLAVVPWHAARRVVAGGEMRHACQDAVISYAASARQFVRAGRRTVRPWAAAPALVRVGESTLYWASREIEHIRARFYPDATYFGGRRRGGSPRATPDNVRTVLPSRASTGASLLHLGAHAHLATPPVDSYLALDGGTRLHVRDMLEQARHRASDVAGGLVVLGACASDHSGREHDEALTLATAFLAAGAVGVVGARWGVEDIPTAIFMIMFHHYLNAGYDDPATALRAAQLWMLNPRRRVPAGVDPVLVAELPRLDLTVLDRWAAFTYQGR
jgi:hypothetical protein